MWHMTGRTKSAFSRATQQLNLHTPCLKNAQSPIFCFCHNSVKNQPILMTFGIEHPHNIGPHLVVVNLPALPQHCVCSTSKSQKKSFQLYLNTVFRFINDWHPSPSNWLYLYTKLLRNVACGESRLTSEWVSEYEFYGAWVGKWTCLLTWLTFYWTGLMGSFWTISKAGFLRTSSIKLGTSPYAACTITPN